MPLVRPTQIYFKDMENQNLTPKKNTHGGRRAGAGRPTTVGSVNRIGLRVPDDIIEILDRQTNRSAFIIEAIRAYDRLQRAAQDPS